MTEYYLIRCTAASQNHCSNTFHWVCSDELPCTDWLELPGGRWSLQLIVDILYWRYLKILCFTFPIIFLAESYSALIDLFVLFPGAARSSPSRPSTSHSKDGRQTPMRATPSSDGSWLGSYFTEKNLSSMLNISFLYGLVESTNQILCISNQTNDCFFGERGKIEYARKEPLWAQKRTNKLTLV